MADTSSHPPTTPTGVHFPEGILEERPKPRQQPTQKYDRKEIQKRLEIENWMEEKLSQLYEVRGEGGGGRGREEEEMGRWEKRETEERGK